MTTNIAIGTPQYGTKKKNNFRIVDGENIYRILPPIGELAQEGIWAVYQSLHWGTKGSKGARPFQCIQKVDFKTKMVKVQCPECDRRAETKKMADDTVAKLLAEGKSKAEADEAVKPLTDWLFSHNLDKKWFVNAMTVDGKIGRLAIPHKMYVQIQEVISDLVNKEGKDPIGVTGGVWFNLVRSGKGNQTSHRVGIVQEFMEVDVGGKKIKVGSPKAAPLTEEILGRLSAEAYDLKNAVKLLTFDEINRIVSSGYDTETVDQVFSTGEIADGDEPEAGATASTPVPNRAFVPPTPSVSVSAVVPAVDQAKAELEAQMKALQEQMSKLQSKAVVTPTASAAPAPTPKATAETMTDEMFLATFGLKTGK